MRRAKSTFPQAVCERTILGATTICDADVEECETYSRLYYTTGVYVSSSRWNICYSGIDEENACYGSLESI